MTEFNSSSLGNYEALRDTMGSVRELVEDIDRIDHLRHGLNSLKFIGVIDVLPLAKSILDTDGKDELDEDALLAGSILSYGDMQAEGGEIDVLPSTEEVVMRG